MIQRDGTVYDGQWSQGVACGYGVLIMVDGFKHFGLFKDNVMVSHLDLRSFLSKVQDETLQQRCKSAKVSRTLSGDSAMIKFSRRPIFN